MPKAWQRYSQSLTMIKGVLSIQRPGRTGRLDKGLWLVVAPPTLHKEALREAHNSKIAGHGGQFKTLERLREMFWWPSMDNDVQDHIAKCESCARFSNAGGHPTPLKPIDAAPRPNYRVHVDLFGPLKVYREDDPEMGQLAEGVRRNRKKLPMRYVLVITDSFTKIVKLVSLPDKTQETVAAGIMDWFYMYGVSKFVVSDQGKEFCNKLQEQLYEKLGIEHKTTTPYHPQCNGQAEVFNKTMKKYLAIHSREAERDSLHWELLLPALAFSYNTGVHKSTLQTPFYTMFGYDPRAPLWSDRANDEREEEGADPAQGLLDLRRSQAVARKVAHANNGQARERYKANADKKEQRAGAQLQGRRSGLGSTTHGERTQQEVPR